MIRNLYLLTLLLVISSALSLSAQDNKKHTGIIRGTITTSDSKPAAMVVVALSSSNKTGLTDEAGKYEFSNLPTGAYKIKVSLLGYQDIIKSVTVDNNTPAVQDFELSMQINELNEIIVASRNNRFDKKHLSSTLRLQQPLLEIPQNIQVVSGNLLAEQQLFNVSEGVGRNVSGVRTLMHQETYASVYIRGFDASGMRNGMSVNGYFGPLKEDMSYVDRVEFVKGPAGFMMGNTQPGGFYNIVTKKPTGISQSAARLTLGSFNTYRAEADVDGRFKKDGRLLYRVNVMGQKKDSWTKYAFNNGFAFVPTLKYLVDDKTSVTLEYQYQFSEFSGFASYIYSMNGFKDMPRNMTYNDPSINPTRVHDQSVFATVEHNIDENWKITGQAAYLNYDMQGQSLYSVYNSLDKEGNMRRNISVNDAVNTAKLGQAFINGKFTTGSVTHRVLAGVDLGQKEYIADWSALKDTAGLSFNVFKPVYGKLKPSDIPQPDRSRSLRERAAGPSGAKGGYSYNAVYIQEEVGLLDNKIRVSVGGRYTNTTKLDALGNDENNHAFTPRVGVNVNVTKNMTVYALYDQSFIEQTGLLVGGGVAKPSKGTNKEIGWKSEWADGRWSATVAAYDITKTNILASAGPDFPGLSIMSGEARSRGIELDLKGEILPNLNVILNYAYMDAKVTKDAKPQNVGAALPGTAKHNTNGWATYRIATGKLQGLGFSLGYSFQDDRAAWPTVTTSLPDAYFSLDAGVSYTQNKFSVNLLFNNLTDKENYTGFYPGAWGYKHYGYQYMTPRSFKLSFGYKF
ncbi:TonB-dependent receptor [Chitinophaga nivalis]|uniref:TonB-dependent receptor n=1 Tax=Chitinophaga nivalis TaxID=2991709 RepID=A0ABT3IUZ6_9BACT|nr:TonB-dependent receptor [Chitinophaga nivalis]MCW3462546.1 TonB-dependent receptor [Chitinophaga nivalis]MCW3487763.1 TonB-dependent receptor [Chitinophaga nivalis]